MGEVTAQVLPFPPGGMSYPGPTLMFIVILLISVGRAVDDWETSKQIGFLSAVGEHIKK